MRKFLHLRSNCAGRDSGTTFDLRVASKIYFNKMYFKRKELSHDHDDTRPPNLSATRSSAAQRDFDHLLGRLFNGNGNDENCTHLAPYGVDIREDQDHLYVEAELPGFKKDDIDITLENQTLTISAERQEEKKAREDKQGRAAASRAALSPVPPQLHAAADSRRARPSTPSSPTAC